MVSRFDESTDEPIPMAERRKAARYLRDHHNYPAVVLSNGHLSNLGGNFAGSIASLFRNGIFMPPVDHNNPGSGLTTRSNSPRRSGQTPPANPDGFDNNAGGKGNSGGGGHNNGGSDDDDDGDGADERRGGRRDGGSGWPQDSDSEPDSSSDKSDDDGDDSDGVGNGKGRNLARKKAGPATPAKIGSAAYNEAGSLAPGDSVLLALRNILKGQDWGRTQGLIIKHPPDAYRDSDFIYEYLDYLEAYRR
ncbi:hypothetical protein HK102_012097, partial [Quaeritorhiza haematococci]